MKSKKKQTKHMRALKDAGALPPAYERDEYDEEKEEKEENEEKDVEVLSEPPDIDTSRAEDKPCLSERFFQVVRVLTLLSLAGPLALLFVFLFTNIILYLVNRTTCTPLDTLRMLNNVNASGVDGDLILQFMFQTRNCQQLYGQR